MHAVFVDCTDELADVAASYNLPVPRGLEIHRGSPTPDRIATLCSGADVLLVEHSHVPGSVFDNCPTIRDVIFLGTGAGAYLDLADLARRSVAVHTTPGYGNRAVAEHALALMLAAMRDIARMDREIRSGLWRPRGGLQLKGRRLAVIGLGGIGTEITSMALSLGMQVRAWNRTRRNHAHYTSDLDHALEGADVVSLHLSLADETRGILDENRLRKLRRGAIVINTARAGLIDEAGLLRALDEGHIARAALDVFPDEPLQERNVYVRRGDVTLTAHAAYMTVEAYRELWSRALAVLEPMLAR